MIHRRESGHPIFRATCALDRGSLKSKGGGQLSIHYNGDSSTAELIFSHNLFRQPAQCLRSDLTLGRRIGPANLRSFVFHHGETRGENE